LDIIGFKDPVPPSTTPTSIGIYEKGSGKQEKTCTLEMRVYRPGYVIEGVSISAETKRRSRRRLGSVKELLEKEFGGTISGYLTPLRDMDNRLRSREPRFGMLPKLGENYKRWEVETLLEHTIVDENGRVTDIGRKIIEGCKSALDPYLEFERLCLLKGIADRLDGLTDVLKLLSDSEPTEVYNVTRPTELKASKAALRRPAINEFYLIDVEDAPALYTFPATNAVVFLSNLSVAEYFRFHYLLRREILKIYANNEGISLGSDKLHKFAGRIRAIELLKNLDIYKIEEGYRFLRFPTNLLRTLALYSVSKSGNVSFDNFLLNLKKDFRILVNPEDLKKVYPFNLSSDHVEAFYEPNFDMFLSRLLHAGIADLKPDGEVVLIE
jgi:hypothetical protein